MEDVLDVYCAGHYDERHPLICMDEASKQLLTHTQEPLPVRPGQPARQDYHYERRGVQALFLFFDPLRGWRRVSCRDSRTRLDWAEEIRILLEEDYPQAQRVTLVCDNLNTHQMGSLYAAFDAAAAHRLKKRLTLHYTPVHGSWLNMAEIELSILARQCLERRIGTKAELIGQIAAWQAQRNAAASRVDWRFTTADARIKLRHLYPHS
jgi:hypothetical protein